jgi:protoporphyrinogen oxidase
MNGKKTAVIIGAGPAGLTAAYELLMRTEITPIIIEKTNDIGGISKTVNYKGNRIDIGGHRFFSKSDRVMDWWKSLLPIQGYSAKDEILIKQKYPDYSANISKSADGPDPEKADRVMLIRRRLSRIYFLRKFFDYPVKLNTNTLSNLGIKRILKIGWDYILVKIFPMQNIRSLEDFFISRFGRELYKTFFKDYTEKVWGVPCKEISAEWGAQRIKELSIFKAVLHAIRTNFRSKDQIAQKDVETSLIEQFLYPKYGPGQMWETVAHIIESKGGRIIKNSEAIAIKTDSNILTEVLIKHIDNNTTEWLTGDFFFSTMPVKELVAAMGDLAPAEVKKVSDGLQYRDFITVGLLLKKLKIQNETHIPTLNKIVPDNWIYIQEKEVKVGRLQIFNNWSPYMVSENDKVWIGLEYFCNEGDELWSKPDDEFMKFAIDELHSIDVIDKNDVIDSTIIRVPKTYPAYFGTYGQFDIVREYLDTFENLFLVGRNGMHKYNNQDHSMLTAMTAVENIIKGQKSKANIWNINTEEEYHEKK